MIMESLAHKLVTTALIYFLFLQLAIRFGIFGPTILDLKNQLDVSQQQMSIIFSVQSIGVCVGAISSGFLFKWVPKQVGLASLLVMLGIVVGFVTSIEEYYLFTAMQFVIGVTSGAAINGCEAWVLEIWGESCPPYMQALQFFRGLGYILGPIIVEPFLAPEVEESMTTVITLVTNATELTTGANGWALNSTELPETENDIKSHIYIPYMINALMLTFGSVMVFFHYLYVIRKAKTMDMTFTSSQANIVSISCSDDRISQPNNEEIEIKSKTTEQPKLFTYSIIILCSLFYLFFFEEVVVTYLASFSANIDLHLSKSRGAFLTSIFNLSNVCGKGFSILLALKLKHFTMLYMNLIVILISLIVLLIFSNTSLVMLWFGVCLLGVGLSSIIASLYALMESSVTMDSMVCGVLNMSGTLGSVFVPLAIASYIESTPVSLIYASLFCAVFCLLIMIFINLLVVFRQRSVKQNQIIREKPIIINKF